MLQKVGHGTTTCLVRLMQRGHLGCCLATSVLQYVHVGVQHIQSTDLNLRHWMKPHNLTVPL